MDRTKIYQILLSFDPYKLNRLIRHVDSLPNNKTSIPVRLLNHLLQHFKVDAPFQAKSEIWMTIAPSEPYADARFRKTCNDALQLVETFISTEAYFGDTLLEASTRLKALSEKSLHPLYKTHYVRVKALMERFPERGPEYYFYQYQIEKNDYEVRQSSLQRFKITNIDAILENLDNFYVIEKLRYFCEVLSRRTFLKHQYNNTLIDEIISLVERGSFSQVPLVQIYYQIILTHLHPDNEEHYFALKTLLQEHSTLLPPGEMKEVYTSALNYCNRRINQGQGKFIQEAFEMYKESLMKELLYDKNKLSHWTFKNVVVLALRLGEFVWAEYFIHEYKVRIPDKFRENAVSYNLAQLHFYQGDYNRVLNLLQTIDYQDVTYNLGAKTMLFATYYELKEWDALYALAESFKVFIHRKKNTISEGRRKSYLNLIKYIIKLQKLKIHQQSEIEMLLDKLQKSTEEVASSNWIKEKIKQKMTKTDVEGVHAI